MHTSRNMRWLTEYTQGSSNQEYQDTCMVETTKMDKHIFEFQFWVQVEWTRVLGRICGGIYQEKKFIRVTFYMFRLTLVFFPLWIHSHIQFGKKDFWRNLLRAKKKQGKQRFNFVKVNPYTSFVQIQTRVYPRVKRYKILKSSYASGYHSASINYGLPIKFKQDMCHIRSNCFKNAALT